MRRTSAGTGLVASLACLAALAAAGCGSDEGGAAADGSSSGDARTVQVAITDAGCEPARLSLPEGPTDFEVQNTGGGAVTELEVLDGDRVLAEAENVAPGLRGSFSLTLEEGDYTLYCPNGTSAERGTLTVTGGGAAQGAAAPAGAAAVGRYRTYLEAQAALLVARLRPFTAAVESGDVATAKRLFPTAREPYERIEPVAESFGDLDPRIDAREGDVPAAGWTGFHRIEKGLWIDGAVDDGARLGRGLLEDALLLQGLVKGVQLQPAQIANGAKSLLDEVAASKITGEEDRYSHTDLWDFAANVEGARAAFRAVRPLLAADDPDLAAEIGARFDDVEAALAPYRRGPGFVLYTSLSPQDTRALAVSIDALAEPLSRVAAIVNR